jgi:hypothetical protein
VVKLRMKIPGNAQLEHIRFRDLRYTFATMALQNGVDVKTVSSMLDHYDAGFTLRTYTYATRQIQEQAAQKAPECRQKLRSGAFRSFPRLSPYGSGCGSRQFSAEPAEGENRPFERCGVGQMNWPKRHEKGRNQ